MQCPVNSPRKMLIQRELLVSQSILYQVEKILLIFFRIGLLLYKTGKFLRMPSTSLQLLDKDFIDKHEF